MFFLNSMLHRRSDWLERALFLGGFVLSGACTVLTLVRGPYQGDLWPLAFFGGVGVAVVVLGVAMMAAQMWQRKLH